MRTARFLSTLAISSALSFGLAAPAFAQNAAPAGQNLSIDGALHANDPAGTGGRHERSRTVQLTAGEGVDIAVSSDAFDTMVRVTGPDGSLVAANDDFEGEGLNSRVRFRAPATGNYQVTVTSYQPGVTGEYHLEVQRGVNVEAASNATANAGNTDNSGANSGDEDGDDEGGDTAQNAPANNGCPGGNCQYPTGVPAAGPQGGVPAAAAGGYPPAPPGFVMVSPGVYVAQGYPTPPGYGGMPGQVATAPSYGGAPAAPVPTWGGGAVPPGYGTGGAVPSATATTGGGQVYGVFVGISDYGGGNDLDFTAQDAVSLATAFLRRGLIARPNAIVLTDGEATPANVRRAFSTIAARMTDRDTFVFFHDGHGASNQIILRSGSMSTQEMSGLLDGMRGQQLVVLDSCYSGSFTPVIRGRPNRLGLFSSTASETSYVASEVNAGGWLAYFMIEAVNHGIGGPNGLHFGELTSYVQQGYNRMVGARQHLVSISGSGNSNATLWANPRVPANVANR